MRPLLKHVRAPQAASGWLWAGILVLLIAACGGLEAPPVTSDTSAHAFISSVTITDADTREAIEATYNADVVVWRPEAGFAVLGLHDTSDGVTRLANVDDNRNVFEIAPAVDPAESSGVSTSGVSAWAGGVSAWAGGVSAWSDGVDGWSDGTSNPFPGNEDMWAQINLSQAQGVATKLGDGIVVAVIDTGVDLYHGGLAGRLTPSSTWLDLIDGNADPHESADVMAMGPYFGHGTAAAGIILQAAPNATIMPIRVLSAEGFGNATDVAIAIDHAIAHGADVINLSLGTAAPVSAITDMVSYAQSLGIVLVASSGNNGTTAVTYPAATAVHADFPLAIGVGSVDSLDSKSWFSTYGPALEMLAPGESVGTLFPDGGIAYANGTSFAAPWVSGVAALALGEGADPLRTPSLVTSSLFIDDLNPDYFSGMLGQGRLDSLAAVNAMLDR